MRLRTLRLRHWRISRLSARPCLRTLTLLVGDKCISKQECGPLGLFQVQQAHQLISCAAVSPSPCLVGAESSAFISSFFFSVILRSVLSVFVSVAVWFSWTAVVVSFSHQTRFYLPRFFFFLRNVMT